MIRQFDEAYWNDRYGSHGHIWSGNPNPQLVAEVSALPAGTALDVGCGEGADAVWLAGRGWQVTGVDISSVALERAAGHAAGLELPGSLAWRQLDLLAWTPPEGAFDLVSAQFMQLPRADRGPLFARLAAAVAPGGTLLVVGHAPSDMDSGARRPHRAEVLFDAGEVVSALDPGLWQVLVAESRPRQSEGHGGGPVAVHDEVVRASRRADV
ncbi:MULTISPECIES: bifunctional 2-polyprenyl-6-hydroxyphenol methylase/3-demethylubiquinol 3-O-methyltransferase UbiG [unclassified Arthrobacter]|uniref:class I SAM-dependent methyltransferase n=1 Tax=unclassified Arthrobacter TaxID=235627 RepID=UPI00159E9E5C|nr:MULTISPECIES: class I SAM-dependent methyltransferase [unclassified Arthrobacter]MCQ9163317.1 methyltransferase domain-containing protein [Arthrobacter sp. STN4]NVM98835.1 methyltransferase domain-containing protein [Arthrobacter sp. SDTb3-6]